MPDNMAAFATFLKTSLIKLLVMRIRFRPMLSQPLDTSYVHDSRAKIADEKTNYCFGRRVSTEHILTLVRN